MKKKYKITIILIGIFFIISLMIGLSYAYYIFSVSQSGTNVVRSDCFEITYTDGDAINLSNTISLTDEEAKELDPYHFTITNVCNSVMEYDVNIETLNNSTIDLNAVAVRLDNRKKKILGEVANNDSSQIVNNNVSSSKSIYNEYLKAGESKTFDLRIWIDEDATIEQSANKTYSSKVVINTKMIPNYSEATLISGPLFNKTLKQLAGNEPSESTLNYYNNLINNENYDPDNYPQDYNIYNTMNDENIKNIVISNQAPTSNITTTVISTQDSPKDILAWFDTDTLYIYSEANRIYLNENAAFSFYNLDGIQSLDLGIFNSSKTKDMSYMFQAMTNIIDLDLSDLDTSNVENMAFMFNSVPKIPKLDLSSFNTSKVTTMNSMFYDSSNVKELDISSFDTSNVEDMSWMFSNLVSLTSLDVSHFNTSKATNMSYMFNSIYMMREINVSSFDTSNVTDMSYMFTNQYILKELDVSSFDTRNATNMSCMFCSVQSVETIYVGDNWSTSQIGPSGYIGASAWTLVGGQGTKVRDGYNSEYQRIDCAPSSPGYLTYKGVLGDTASYCASLN